MFKKRTPEVQPRRRDTKVADESQRKPSAPSQPRLLELNDLNKVVGGAPRGGWLVK